MKTPTHTATFVSDQGARHTVQIYETEKCWVSPSDNGRPYLYRKATGRAVMSGWQANRRILLDTIAPIDAKPTAK